MGFFGQHVALSEVGDQNSETHKKAVARLPLEYESVDAGKGLTLGQASNVVRVLLGLEAEANPMFVGFPLTVVTIPLTGSGSVATYQDGVPPEAAQPR